MDFNSNDEYLKAFPPNFGPKLGGLNMLNQLSNFQVHKVLPKNRQIPEPACLYEEFERVEAQEPIQVRIPAVNNAENKGAEILKAHPLCQEDLAPARDQSSLAQPEINEPMPQVADMTLVMGVQRDNEMGLGESDGERGEPRIETALPLQAIETRVLDGETLLSDTHQVEGPPFAIQITRETTIHCEIPAEDAVTIGVIEESILALDNIGHDEAEKSVSEEAIGVATTKDAIFGLPPLRELVEGTQICVEQERPITDIDTVEGNAMDTEALQDVQNGQPASTADTLDRIEFVEETTTTLIETSEKADAMSPIETQGPVTLEMIQTTTVRATYETQTSQNERTEHTQIKSQVLGTDEDATMAFEITEKTTIKAKAICPCEGEEPPFAMNGVPSASNSTTGFDDPGTSFDADVDKIVDSIMNDIADIEAGMEVEKETDMESNTQRQKLEICGKSIGMESTAICQDHIQSMGSHV